MCCLPAAHLGKALNGGFLVLRTRTPDPMRPDEIFIGSGGLCMTKLPTIALSILFRLSRFALQRTCVNLAMNNDHS